MAATFTPELNLAKPATGDLDWGPEVDGNFDILDAAVYANREDRWIRVTGGGTLLYTALSGQISFTEDIVFYHGINGFTSTLPASESPLVCSAAGHLTYALMGRNLQANETISSAQSNLFRDQVAVPNSNNSIVIAQRDNTAPTNQVILMNGTILLDGQPGSLSGGSFVTLTTAYNDSVNGEIALSSNSKYFRVQAEAGPVDVLIQSYQDPGTMDALLYPTPTQIALANFTLGSIESISRLNTWLGLTGSPSGNYRYKIVQDSSGSPTGTVEYTGPWTAVSTVPIVATDQPQEIGSPVSLNPGTYWFVIEVDGTYQSSADGSDYIAVARTTAASPPPAAIYNASTTLWTPSANHYYNQIWQSEVESGAELFTVSQASGGLVSVANQAAFETTGQTTANLSFTGIHASPVVSITNPATIVLNQVQQMLTVSPGDDLYLRNADPTNDGLYRILTIAVNTPTSGQTQITIDQTYSLKAEGYHIAFATTETPGSATADILRASDTNRTAVWNNDSSQKILEIDSFRNRLLIDADLIVLGTQTFIDTETEVAETFLIDSGLTLSSQVLLDVNNTGSNGYLAKFRLGATNALAIPFSGGIQVSRDIIFTTDNTYNIGESGVTRPANIYVANSVVVGNTITITTNTILGSTSLALEATTSLTFEDQYVTAPLPLTLVGTDYTAFSTLYSGHLSVLGALTNIPDGALTTPYIKADGTRALTGNWNAGAFSATFNSVDVGSALNTISGLATIINGAATLTLPTSTDTIVGRDTTDTLENKSLQTVQFIATTDSTSTGSSATIAAITSIIVRLTNASLTSISGIPAGGDGQYLILENHTGASVEINNDDAGASAANRIITGTSANMPMADDAAFSFIYDTAISRWVVASGGGTLYTEVQETPAGATDGTNRTFVTTYLPVSASALKVYVNRAYLSPSYWSLTSQTITIVSGYQPTLGQSIGVDYVVSGSSLVSIGGTSFVARYQIFVDPVNGNDSTGTGSANNPYLTIEGAQATITDNSSSNIYILQLMPGVYPEAGPIAMMPFVFWNGYTDQSNMSVTTVITANVTIAISAHLQSFGMANIDLQGTLTKTLSTSGTGLYFSGCAFQNTFDLEGLDQTVYVDNCNFESGAIFGAINSAPGSQILFLDHCTGDITIQYATMATIQNCVLNSLTVYHQNTITIIGSVIPTITNAGVSVVTLNIDQFDNGTDSITPVLVNPSSGSFTIVYNSNRLLTVTSGTTTLLGDFDTIAANASSGSVILDLPEAANFQGKIIHIVRTDTSGNTVTITPANIDTINSSAGSVTLSVGRGVAYIPDSTNTNWITVSTIGGSGGGPVAQGTFASPIAINPTVGLVPTSDLDQVWWVTPTTATSGAIPITATPQIAAGTAVGQRLMIFGITNGSGGYFTFANGNGIYSPSGDFQAQSGQCLIYMWNGTAWQFVSNAI